MIGAVAACGGGGAASPSVSSPSDATAVVGEGPDLDVASTAPSTPADESSDDADAPTSSTATDAGGFTPLVPAEGVTVTPSGADVASDDGRLVLSFPKGAVADDTVVAVAVLPADEWPDDLAALDPASLVYQLEPSGLTFDDPVAFTLTTDVTTADDGLTSVPLAILIDEEGTGEFVGLDAELDLGAGVAVVSGEIEHFSRLIHPTGTLTVGLEQVSPKNRKLGQPWKPAAQIHNGTIGIQGENGEQISELRDFTISAISFDSSGAAQVVGSTTHPGFKLAPGAIRRLDSPAPRWQCVDLGEGVYTVSATAPIDESGMSAFEAVKRWVFRQNTSLVFTATASVNCQLPTFSASGGGARLSVSGEVDITAPFALQGNIVGGQVSLVFTPTDTGSIVNAETMTISSSGTFTYSGTANTSGSGTYAISGPIGQPLVLTHIADGCTNPGTCQGTEGEIVLTPLPE
jgi:hypothetical protein